MKKISKPLAIEYWIDEFIYNLKKKTVVTISDVEAFCNKALNLVIAIEDLRKSRDNWRAKYDELKLEVKKMAEEEEPKDEEKSEED